MRIQVLFCAILASVVNNDNFIKAFLDTARWIGLIPEDDLRYLRGIVQLELGFRDPVSISDDGMWHFTWALFKSLEP